jgi:hypothetical protein
MRNAIRKVVLIGMCIFTGMVAQATSNSQQEQPPLVYNAGPSHPLPQKTFISSQFTSIICPNRVSAVAMLDSMDKSELPAALKLNRCRYGQVPIKIEYALDRRNIKLSNQAEAKYIAFVGSSRHYKNNEAKMFGVINETANDVAPNTPFESWQDRFAPVKGLFSLYPNSIKDTTICLRPATALKLIEAKKAISENPSDQKLVKRIELLLKSCPPSYGTFQPLTMMQQWESANGWTWTAIKAKDEKGNVVGLLHVDL